MWTAHSLDELKWQLEKHAITPYSLTGSRDIYSLHVRAEVQTMRFRVQVSFEALKIKKTIKCNSASPHMPFLSQSRSAVRGDSEIKAIAEIWAYYHHEVHNQWRQISFLLHAHGPV
jgi:hypothetical protein